MKRKIILGLAVYAIVFLCGGLYVLHTLGSTSVKLDNLIMLHQVEILREHYLIQIRRVQTDLILRDTKFAPDTWTIVSNAERMSRVVRTCSDCHHRPEVAARLAALQGRTEEFKRALSRVLTVHGNPTRLAAEKERAFRAGEGLIGEVSDMIALTGARLEASTARALTGMRRTITVLLVLLGIAPLVSVILGVVLVRGLTKPLEVLVESTRKVTAGQLDHRVGGLKDEFGELGEAVNAMASSLREQIVERERTEQMARLGRLSAGLAHEIKNPLAGIKVAMEILAGEETMSEENREVARKVREEVGRVETLMRSLLSFARPPQPQPAEIDVNALVASSVALHARDPRFEDHHPHPIRLRYDLGQPPVVVADPMQLEQVIVNLFLNAIEAMPEGGTLTVRTAPNGEPRGARIEVADSGKGVPPGDAERIFEPFFTTKTKGTGLGLAISRQLVQRNRGTLTLSPNPEGGSIFTIALPARQAADADGVPG